MAVGEPTQGIVLPRIRGNCPLADPRVNRRVRGSTTAMFEMVSAVDRLGDKLAGSWVRSKLNLTAAASSVVPSENLTLGRSFRSQTLASVEVIPSASWATRS